MRFVDLPSDMLDADVAAALFFEDERPLCGPAALADWRLNGMLTDMIVTENASGRAGEKILIQNNGKMKVDWIFFMGGGSLAGLGPSTYERLIEHLLASCMQAGFKRIALPLFLMEGIQLSDLKQMVASVLNRLGSGAPECLVSLVE